VVVLSGGGIGGVGGAEPHHVVQFQAVHGYKAAGKAAIWAKEVFGRPDKLRAHGGLRLLAYDE
jgi:hypothetical protein